VSTEPAVSTERAGVEEIPPSGQLVAITDAGRRPPLYCLHPISGSAFVYAGLARSLGPDQPVSGFDAPGLDDGREPIGRFDELCALYTEELLRTAPAASYRLLGWSMGGTLAFDIAQRLVAAGARVPSLILIDASVPEIWPLPAEPEMIAMFLSDLLQLSGISAPGLDRALAAMAPEVPPEVAFAEIERLGGLPEEIEADFLLERYRVFRAHLGGMYRHRIDRPYDGALISIRAAASEPESMRWDTVAKAVTEHVLPGDHHSIWQGQSFASLVRLVRESLDAAGEDR